MMKRHLKKSIEEVYVLYMNNDTTGLLNDDFYYMIDDMKEQGKIVENVSDIEEKYEVYVVTFDNNKKEVFKDKMFNTSL